MSFVIGQDFNTKDWFVYDDDTRKRVFFDSELEAAEYITDYSLFARARKEADNEN